MLMFVVLLHRLSLLDHCLEGACLVLKTLSKKKQIEASKIELEVIRSSVALVLSVIHRLGSLSFDNKKVDQLKKNAEETIHDFLNTWIRRVVGSVFGGMPSYWTKTSTRLDRETKVHDILFVIGLI